MDMDQERPIEKLLRGAARDRRQQRGDSWGLHPATKRLLECEVARVYPGKAASEARWSWVRLWPRLVWASGVCAVLACALWSVWPERQVNPALAMQMREKVWPSGTDRSAVLPEAARQQERLHYGIAAADQTSDHDRAKGVSNELFSLGLKERARRGTVRPTASTDQPATITAAPPALAERDMEDKSASLAKQRFTWDDQRLAAGVTTRITQELAQKSKDSEGRTSVSRESIAGIPAAAAMEQPEIAHATLGDSSVFRTTVATQQQVLARNRREEMVAEPNVFYGMFQSVPTQTEGGFATRNYPDATAGRRVEGAPAAPTSRGAGVKSMSVNGAVGTSGALASGARPTEKKILQNFAVNQQGAEVVVIDGDGSVYRGPVQEQDLSAAFAGTGGALTAPSGGGNYFARYGAEQAETSPDTNASSDTNALYAFRSVVTTANAIDSKPATSSAPAKTLPANIVANSFAANNAVQTFINFSVTGLNNTLNRKVEFAGKLLVANSNLSGNSNLFSNAASNSIRSNQNQAATANAPYQNQVLGKATVEGLRVMEINASQVPADEPQNAPARLPGMPATP